jgi:hypothetical protein
VHARFAKNILSEYNIKSSMVTEETDVTAPSDVQKQEKIIVTIP